MSKNPKISLVIGISLIIATFTITPTIGSSDNFLVHHSIDVTFTVLGVVIFLYSTYLLIKNRNIKNTTRHQNKHLIWKQILAFVFDFFASSLLIGFTYALLTGQVRGYGFYLHGLDSLMVYLLVILYFLIMNRYFGGTFGRKLFKITRHEH